jgi:hypothetical protein
MGGVYCENADIAVLESADPATGWKLGDARLHNGAMPYGVDPKSADPPLDPSEQLVGLKSW